MLPVGGNHGPQTSKQQTLQQRQPASTAHSHAGAASMPNWSTVISGGGWPSSSAHGSRSPQAPYGAVSLRSPIVAASAQRTLQSQLPYSQVSQAPLATQASAATAASAQAASSTSMSSRVRATSQAPNTATSAQASTSSSRVRTPSQGIVLRPPTTSTTSRTVPSGARPPPMSPTAVWRAEPVVLPSASTALAGLQQEAGRSLGIAASSQHGVAAAMTIGTGTSQARTPVTVHRRIAAAQAVTPIATLQPLPSPSPGALGHSFRSVRGVGLHPGSVLLPSVPPQPVLTPVTGFFRTEYQPSPGLSSGNMISPQSYSRTIATTRLDISPTITYRMVAQKPTALPTSPVIGHKTEILPAYREIRSPDSHLRQMHVVAPTMPQSAPASHRSLLPATTNFMVYPQIQPIKESPSGSGAVATRSEVEPEGDVIVEEHKLLGNTGFDYPGIGEQRDYDDDPQLQGGIGMIPPSPPNTLADFLSGVCSGDIQPVMVRKDVQVDNDRYWEKRRVQSLLRRVLESLQDNVFNGNRVAGDSLVVENAFDQMVADTRSLQPSSSGTSVLGLKEEAFIEALERMQAWPPELSAEDKREVFLAFLVPTSTDVMSLCRGPRGQPLDTFLDRRRFCKGVDRIPFNVPDFPVPTHLLESRSTIDVAAAIKQEFVDKDGAMTMKDFYLCGLVSMEEIQISLPWLVPLSDVEQAVKSIISAGLARFSEEEFDKLVRFPLLLLNGMAALTAPIEAGAICLEDISGIHLFYQEDTVWFGGKDNVVSGDGEKRRVVAVDHRGGVVTVDTPLTNAYPRGTVIQIEPGEQDSQITAAIPEDEVVDPATSRLPETQNVGHSEESMRDAHAEVAEAPARASHHVCDWSTAGSCTQPPSFLTSAGGEASFVSLGSGADSGSHQADQGAGTGQGVDQPKSTVGLALAFRAAEQTGQPGVQDNNPRTISLEQHTECRGPFLTKAFVRCCELFELR
eukprot:TRINITY_DN102458_c0_g1_i1.p1 TRINITY_DN102458_c0_g1~~TRINITY_DN102458_c0_g1_i1.p1  ORF type:complete len:967 (-),score=111.43 TRINITY_DN102458_c0_g1_i1:138-3038(-)